MKRMLVLCVMLLLPLVAFAALDGDVDETFNAPDGFSFVPGTVLQRSGVDTVVEVLSLPDGKIIVVGNAAWGFAGQDGTEYTNAIRVQRLLADGSVDSSFGNSGRIDIVSPYQSNEYYEATSAALGPDGRIAIVGFYQENFYPRQSMAVWMVNESGQVDTDFGNAGMLTYEREVDWSQDTAYAIHAFTPRDHQAGLNPSFGYVIVGEVRDDLSPGDSNSNPGPRRGMEWIAAQNGSSLSALELEDNVSLHGCPESPLHAVTAGENHDSGEFAMYLVGDLICENTTYAYVHRQLLINGGFMIDFDFGVGSISDFSYTPYAVESLGASVAIDAEGRPVIAGNVLSVDGWNRFGVARLTTAGQFDTSFYTDGARDVNFRNYPASDQSRVNLVDVLVQKDGKIVVGGDVEQQGINGVYFMMRMNADGSGDSRFIGGDHGLIGWIPDQVVTGAVWYESPTGAYVHANNIHANAMTFTQGERLLMAGSIPEGNDGAFGLVERFDNDGIFTDGFGW